MSVQQGSLSGPQAASGVEGAASGGTASPPHDRAETHRAETHHLGVIVMYLVAMGVVVAAAVVLTILLRSSAFFWPLTLIGAVVICALLTAAAMPYFRSE